MLLLISWNVLVPHQKYCISSKDLNNSIRVWNNMRVSKWWQNSHVWFNYPYHLDPNSVFRIINLTTTVCSQSKWNETSSRVGRENPSWLHHPICQYSQIKSFSAYWLQIADAGCVVWLQLANAGREALCNCRLPMWGALRSVTVPPLRQTKQVSERRKRMLRRGIRHPTSSESSYPR